MGLTIYTSKCKVTDIKGFNDRESRILITLKEDERGPIYNFAIDPQFAKDIHVGDIYVGKFTAVEDE